MTITSIITSKVIVDASIVSHWIGTITFTILSQLASRQSAMQRFLAEWPVCCHQAESPKKHCRSVQQSLSWSSSRNSLSNCYLSLMSKSSAFSLQSRIHNTFVGSQLRYFPRVSYMWSVTVGFNKLLSLIITLLTLMGSTTDEIQYLYFE